MTRDLKKIYIFKKNPVSLVKTLTTDDAQTTAAFRYQEEDVSLSLLEVIAKC